jgi:ADP-ribose pyrophosphatase
VVRGTSRQGSGKLIRDRRTAFSTPWFELTAKQTDLDPQPFYSIKQADYVSVIAITAESDLVLVRQYRPAVEAYTLELPSGLVDEGSTPEAAAMRELEEEAGYTGSEPELLGVLYPDTGRLQNRMWCFAVRHARQIPGHKVERGMEPVIMKADRVEHALRAGELSCALHYAAFLLLTLRSKS